MSRCDIYKRLRIDDPKKWFGVHTEEIEYKYCFFCMDSEDEKWYQELRWQKHLRWWFLIRYNHPKHALQNLDVFRYICSFL
jgi:hypothetical protein